MWSNISSFSRNLKAIAGRKQQDEQNEKDCFGSPLMRYKHAVCSTSSGYIYIHGGRFGNASIDDDVWRFDPHQNTWLQLETSGSRPPNLQEHTLVEYGEFLYLFGGQVSASNMENSFWRLNLLNNEWHSLSMKSSKLHGAYLGPTNRRGHSAVIYNNSMYIFGGFEDFRGSSAQLWEYDLLNERWELRNLSSTSACHPEPRHSHSAIVYEHSMYVYGGLSDLKPLSDLWCWSWRQKRWFKERTRGKSPGRLHGHTAIQAFGSMFVFGGERNGRTTRSLWRLNLANLTWQKIRPKGPRPNPTTWHGAIANPLNILDEANYLVEGDSEFMKSNLLSEHNSLVNYELTEQQQNNVKQEQPAFENLLKHSQSVQTNNELTNFVNASAAKQHQQHQRRKSRLSFLRKSRQTRPKSTYELKQQMYASASASNFNSLALTPATDIERHSISVVPQTSANVAIKEKQEPAEIFDNLDTDIKKMFNQAALSSSREKACNEEPMSIDESKTFVSSKSSQYETAVQNEETLDSSLMARSQRTSYAYTTPPSEANTIREEPTINESIAASGAFSRRDNRPKSEIVQSLIDRADARIKHLYTPFFNYSNSTSNETSALENYNGKLRSNSERVKNQKNRHSLDKSKRHTIHQTMTYYNLYFSEDKSSSSPSSDNTNHSNNNNSPPNDNKADRAFSNNENLQASSGTLVGIHHGASSTRAPDQESQLSLEATSSDSKTICGDLNFITPSEQTATASYTNNSIPNALTARRDTGESSGDNTSLSFSVIAEFEEDDMLQYSSPTDPVIQHAYNTSGGQSTFQNYHSKPVDSGSVTAKFNSIEINMQDAEAEQQKEQQVAHKSASSGYDSISGYEQQSNSTGNIQGLQRKATNNQGHNVGGTSTSDTQEDSSVRTESSLGFTTTEASPEQSAIRRQYKKMKGKSILYKKNKNQVDYKTATSSTTTDSLILTSDGFESSITRSKCLPPTKSLPSSPPENGKHKQSMAMAEQQRKLPLMSKSSFFGRQKSKNRYWQLCMFVIGGKQGGAHGVNEPITIWRLYI